MHQLTGFSAWPTWSDKSILFDTCQAAAVGTCIHILYTFTADFRIFEIELDNGCCRRVATSDLGPRTSDLGSRTSNLGSRTWDLGPRVSDLEPRTSDLEPRTSDLGPRTSDLGPRTSDLEPWTWYIGTSDLEPRTSESEPRTSDLEPKGQSGETNFFLSKPAFFSKMFLCFSFLAWMLSLLVYMGLCCVSVGSSMPRCCPYLASMLGLCWICNHDPGSWLGLCLCWICYVGPICWSMLDLLRCPQMCSKASVGAIGFMLDVSHVGHIFLFFDFQGRVRLQGLNPGKADSRIF